MELYICLIPGLTLFSLINAVQAQTVESGTLTQSNQVSPALEMRLDLSQLGSADNVTERHILFSQLRATLDAALGDWEFHADGRGRLGWTDVGENKQELTRLFLSYKPSKRIELAVGRQVVEESGASRLDGLSTKLLISNNFQLRAFLGLMPHPLDGAFNVDFATFGMGYRARGEGLENLGGLVFNTYGSKLDRVYIAQRLLWQPHRFLTLFGFVVVDLLAPRGVLGDLQGVEPNAQTHLQRLDLTNAQLSMRLKSSNTWDLKLRLSHHHTILPSAWWRDWLEQERARRGFIPDEQDALGTRRSNVQLTGNLHLSRAVSSYTTVRFDRRHSDRRNGYETRTGLKLRFGKTSYANTYYSYRRYFVVNNHLTAVRFGLELTEHLHLESGATAMHSTHLETKASRWLFDVDGSLWFNLGSWSKTLDGFSMLIGCQAFIDYGIAFFVGHARLIYRFRT